jgi:Trypsin-co-occurring domain 2
MSNGNDEVSVSAIPLAKAIQDLRNELLQAVAEGKGKELRFKLDPIELELSLGMTYKAGANASVKFWVLDIGAKGDVERAATHKLKLKLSPVDKGGNQFMVRDTMDKLPD